MFRIVGVVREMLATLEPSIAQYGGRKVALRRLKERERTEKQKKSAREKKKARKVEEASAEIPLSNQESARGH